MKIIFLILNYKTFDDTIRVANELLSANRDDYKILIIDNASPNESYKVLSGVFNGNMYVDVILSLENGGYAKGNNWGLRYAKKYNPTYVCIINNDVHFSWDTIDKLIDIYPMLDKPALISPLQKLPNESFLSCPVMKVPNLWYDIRLYCHLFGLSVHKYESNTEYENVQRVGIIPGAFLFVKYSVFERLGFFNESTFLFGEERFTGKTVKLAGLNNYLILDLSYLHEHSKTINAETSRYRQRKMMHRGRILYHKTYDRFPIVSIVILNIFFWKCQLESIIGNSLIKLRIKCMDVFAKFKQ